MKTKNTHLTQPFQLTIKIETVLEKLCQYKLETGNFTAEEYLSTLSNSVELLEIAKDDSSNWNAPLDCHFEYVAYTCFETKKCFVKFKPLQATDSILLEFNLFDDFLFALLQSNNYFTLTIELEEDVLEFEVDVDILSDFVRVSQNNDHLTELIVTDMEDLKEKIKNHIK